MKLLHIHSARGAGFITEDPNIFEEYRINDPDVQDLVDALEREGIDASKIDSDELIKLSDQRIRVTRRDGKRDEATAKIIANIKQHPGGEGKAGGGLNKRELVFAKLASKAVGKDLTSPEAYEQIGRSKGVMDVITDNTTWSRIPWGDLMNAQPSGEREKVLRGLLANISRG